MTNPHLPIDFDQEEGLLEKHLEEWTNGSGVDEEIVRLNVTSYSGNAVHELLIGDQLDDAGGHGQQFVTGEVRALLKNRDTLALGGWYCEGVDLQNGCQSPANFGVYKPDFPRVKANGKEAKYEHPAGVNERIVALRMPADPDYWARIKADPSIDIVLDESGGKKPGAWLTAGIPGLGVPGIWAGTPPADSDDPEPSTGFGYGDSAPKGQFIYKPKDRILHPDLAVLAPGRRFIISFDYESTPDGKKRRDSAVRLLVDQLYAAGASCVALAHREGPEKGSDDLLIAQGPEALHQLVATADDCNRGPITPSYSFQKSKELNGHRDPADLLADYIVERIRTAAEPPLDQLANTPGTGKSHLVPQVGPRLVEQGTGIDRVIYVSSTYRSPSISALQRWVAPPSRHSGLVVENIDGHQRLRRRKKSDPESIVVEQANCQYSGNLQRLRNQGGSTESITHFCRKQCPVRDDCKYRQDQQEFIQGLKSGEHRLIRCSTESLPALEYWLGEKDWANTYLIFDEAPQLESAAIKTSQIPLDRFASWGTYLRTVDPQAMATAPGQQLTALLDALGTLPDRITDPKERKYGLQPQRLVQVLPPVPLLDSLDLAPLDAGVQEMAADADHQHQTDSPLLLAELIRALGPKEEGALPARAFYSPLEKGTITVISGAVSLMATAHSAAGSLVLDGTAVISDITRALYGFKTIPVGHSVPQAIKTPSALKMADLEVIQIADLGPMGANRGEDKQRRVKALLPAIADWVTERFGPDSHTGVLEKSTFRCRESGHGIWFVDNQGSNAYENDRALIMVGCPSPNLTASLAQYQVTHHDLHATLNSTAFRNWYGARMGEQLVQAFHRLRPIRRPGETLLLILITDLDLKGLRICNTDGRGNSFKKVGCSYFTKAAAPKKERTHHLVVTAIKLLHLTGIPVEQISTRMVADRAKCSQSSAAKQRGDLQWKEFVQECIG